METNRPGIHYAWIVAGLALLVVFASLGLARFGYASVLPAMQQSLGLDNTQAGLLATANLAGYLAMSFVGGALASRFGPRIVIAGGLFLVAAGMLMTGLSDHYAEAALWRAVTGIGSGASNVPVMGLVASWAAASRRGLLSGIAVTGSSFALMAVGFSVPPLLANIPVDGWRIAWYGFAALTAVIAAASLAGLRNRPAERGLLPLGADAAASAVPAPRASWTQVYRSPAVWHLGLVYVAFGFSYIIYMTFFIRRLVGECGYSNLEAGKLFTIMGACGLLCGIVWGAVSDRLGRRRTLMALYLLQVLAYILFAAGRHPVALTLSAVVFGLCAWSIPAIMAAACGDQVGPQLTPAALGFVTLFFGLGQALGPAVAGALADHYGTFIPAFLLAAAVAAAGALITMTLRADTKGPTAAPLHR